MPAVAETSSWERVNLSASAALAPDGDGPTIDRDKRIIRGVILAEAGHFKTKGRGQFTPDSLRQIVDLANSGNGLPASDGRSKRGLKSRLAHPTLSNDGIGSHLGRFHDARLDKQNAPTKVYADLHFGEAASKSPNGDLADYVMTMAEEDPDSFGTSLVLRPTYLNPKTMREQERNSWDEKDPSIWMPAELHASDVVDTGDATNSFLSADDLKDRDVRLVSAVLDKQFGDMTRDEVRSRALSFVDKYLVMKFGEEAMATEPATKPVDDTPAAQPLESREPETTPAPAPVAQLETPQGPTVEQLLERNQQIRYYCRLHGCDEKQMDAFLNDPKLQLVDVLKHLSETFGKQRAIIAATAAPLNAPSVAKENTIEDKLREQYRNHRFLADLKRSGITEDQYVKTELATAEPADAA